MTPPAELRHASSCGGYFGVPCDCPVAEVERLRVRIAELQAELDARTIAQPASLARLRCGKCGQTEPHAPILAATRVRCVCGAAHVLVGGQYVMEA